MDKLVTEAIGIDFVCAELVQHGHTVISKHYRIRQYEIDIVTEYRSQRIFHEVRTTHSNDIQQVFPFMKVICICNAVEHIGKNCSAQFHYIRLSSTGKIAEYQQLFASDLL